MLKSKGEKMEIVKENNFYDKHINNIKIGETFLYKGQLHIKVSGGSLEQFLVGNTYENLVLNLEDSTLNSINGKVEVQVSPIPAKIVM